MDAIALSATHVYISALAFLPNTSLLHPLYTPLVPDIPRVISDRPLRSQPVHAVHSRQCKVKSACISSDGTWILAALLLDPQSSCAVLQQVDLHTGTTIGPSISVDGTILDVKLYMDDERQCAATAVTDGYVIEASSPRGAMTYDSPLG